MVSIAAIALCSIEARSLKSAETLKPSNEKRTIMIKISTVKQIKTAIVLEMFFFSIHLQKGKNRVAKIPPMHNGIRKSFAKYNPAKIKNTNTNFLITDDSDVVILLGIK